MKKNRINKFEKKKKLTKYPCQPTSSWENLEFLWFVNHSSEHNPGHVGVEKVMNQVTFVLFFFNTLIR